MVRNLNIVDFKAQQQLIGRYPSDVVKQLAEFGGLMTAEVQQRSAHIDAKLGAYLGYSVALIGLLSVGAIAAPSPMPILLRIGILLSVAFAMGTIGVVAGALKSAEYPVPSEQDWFKRECINNHEELRDFHVTALLYSHQLQQKHNVCKAKDMQTAEWLMTIAGILAGLVIVIRILFV